LRILREVIEGLWDLIADLCAAHELDSLRIRFGEVVDTLDIASRSGFEPAGLAGSTEVPGTETP